MNVIKWILMEAAKVFLIVVMWVAPLEALKVLNCKECLWMFPLSVFSTYIVTAHYSYVEKEDITKSQDKEDSDGK